MRQYSLTEDRRLPKIPVRFSDQICAKIEEVNSTNQFEIDEIKRWHDYLDAMVSRISDPVIAWDNTNIYQHHLDGTTRIRIDEYDVTFTFEEDEKTKRQYILIISADLKIEEYNLKDPSLMYENKIRLRRNVYTITESHLCSIITETINTFIRRGCI